MSITDPTAIKFCNDHMRHTAGRMARCKYRGKQLSEKWDSLGGDNDSKFAVLKGEIEKVATLITRTYRLAWWMDRLWQSAGMFGLIPNDAEEIVFDNAEGTGPDLDRGEINGQDVTRVKRRAEEFINHLSRGTDIDKHWLADNIVIAEVTNDYFDHLARMSQDGSESPTTAWGRVAAVDRCGDIVTEYEVINPNKFDHILKVSALPGPGE